jgi:hypothetical protein
MRVRVMAAIAGVVLLGLGIGWFALGPGAEPRLPGWGELDDRWGPYLSEREWGNPREAVGGDGWGLDYLQAIRTEYRYGEDGIAGLTDRDGTFNLGWAVWDEQQVRVAERLFGWYSAGDHGEEIVDRRTFGQNTPTSSYHSMVLVYPNSDPRYEIVFEAARLDSRSGVICATATNTSAEPAALHLVVKGWFHDPSLEATLDGDELTLTGPSSVVVMAVDEPSGGQVSSEKGALDANLRTGGLVDAGGGHIGAFDFALDLDPAEPQQRCAGWAEAPDAATAGELADQARRSARSTLERRAGEAAGLFAPDVSAHREVYQAALMSLLWSQSLYTWDGATSFADWGGSVEAHDVLIMPDKWEFPWLASWDSAFHAVSASLIDPELGAAQLRFILSDRWQQPNGHVPCAEWVMEVECPPLFAWSAWRVAEAGAGTDLLDELWPALERHYRYWWDELQVADSALFTGGFLGMDNLPDRGLGGELGTTQADASAWMALFARHMALIAAERGDPDSAAAYRADLERIAEGINTELWDEDSGLYLDRRADGAFVRTESYSGLIPLIAGVVPADRLEVVIDQLRDESEFLSPAGIRSVSARSVLYQPGYADQPGVNSNWRGPVWLPINYLLVGVLDEVDPEFARDLRERLVETVERDWEATGHFHEYFDAETGEGLGADQQTGWTALVANLIVEGWPAD